MKTFFKVITIVIGSAILLVASEYVLSVIFKAKKKYFSSNTNEDTESTC